MFTDSVIEFNNYNSIDLGNSSKFLISKYKKSSQIFRPILSKFHFDSLGEI